MATLKQVYESVISKSQKRGPMPTVTYDGATYTLKSRNLAVPDFTTMSRFEALQWLVQNTRGRGYSRPTNPLRGMGAVLKVRSRP